MINSVVIQGRLARDPEIKTTQSGSAVANFTVCWSDKYKETETKLFLPCKAWRGTAEFVGKYFRKGQEVAVDGRLIAEEWEKDGIFSYLFPILRFHDRWETLEYEDIQSLFGVPQVSDNGYLMQVGVVPMTDAHAQPEPEDFTVPALGNIYRVLRERTRTGTVSLASLSGSLSTDEASLLTNLLQKPETVANGQSALSDYIDIMETERRNREQSDDLLGLAETLRKKKGYRDQDGN